jgi:hypothetical protein
MAQLAGHLAEYVELLKEVYCYGKLASVANMNYAGLSIPVSETNPGTGAGYATYPWAASSGAFPGGGYNKPTSFSQLSQAGIQSGLESLMVQKNLLGLIMAVKPRKLLISPINQFNAMILMQSTLNPSMSSTATGDIGKVGGISSVNPITSILDPVVSRYLFNNSGVTTGLSQAWYIVDASKPFFVLQLRDPGSVIMENPESGESFNRDVIRHRLKVRLNADWIDPRFAWQGDDGSV